MMAGINIIVGALTYLNSIFTHGFGMTGYITDVAAIAGLANRELGSEVAMTLLVIFAVNIIIARITPFKYIFLTGQALLWMATIGAVIGYKAGLTGMPLILTGGIFGGVMAVLMPALAQPVVRKITGSDEVALGHFCTIGYLVQAAVAKVVGKGSRSTEDLELPDNFKFLQDTYLSMAVGDDPDVPDPRTGGRAAVHRPIHRRYELPDVLLYAGHSVRRRRVYPLQRRASVAE
ncbi:PTS system ascorbate-specific transporter subunit IIC [Serratia plymuthica]|uniref:Ascorbate-specific PTS system EIIC component n=1 Tax=Serratia plymuthica TaxID=82996 RepID=A0A2X4V1S1_SERPL|nr:PTS system ascorbate-specific transporter subunit IIC [Serratia plymuthica]